jgi:PKD repeat protein
MRKAFTILAALVLAFSFSFAQVNYNQVAKRVNNTTKQKAERTVMNSTRTNVDAHVFQTSTPAKYMKNNRNQHYRVSGNPYWELVMSYCMDGEYANSIGTNTVGDTVYWGIKIESAALTGRNNITNVQFYVQYAGVYTLNIFSGAEPTGTPIATQTVTATQADEEAWKTITFASPVAINQNQDMWVILSNTDVNYPATGVVGTEYDNGKLISTDGEDWFLISEAGLDYTWMIKVTTDTYAPSAPILNLVGPAEVENGDTVTYTVSSPNATSFTWNITADYTNINGATAQVMWNTDGMKQVSVTSTNATGTTTENMDVEVYTCSTVTDFPYVNGFETGTARCWTKISMDPSNDDYFGVFEDDEAHGGNYDFWFCSYYEAEVTEDYNQYLITPELQLPATGNYMVKFYYRGVTSSDAFKVLVSTTNNNLSSFTELADYPTVPTTDWGVAELQLPAGTKYVAINYYGEYLYLLYIDDFSIESLNIPEVTLDGPTAVLVGGSGTYTATSPLADSYAWMVDGTAVAGTTNTLTTTFTTEGDHTVQVIASNTAGSDTASLTVDVYTCNVITTFPYTDGFENGLRCYTMISNDPTNDDLFGVIEHNGAYEGDHDFIFSSYYTAEDYNQYLISPELQLPAGEYMVKFYALGYSNAESFKVLVSTTTDALSSFTELADFPNPAMEWTEIGVQLPAGTKYVAINYYADYQYYLFIDNLSIEALGAPTVTITGPESTNTGTPVTFTANSPLATTFAWTVDGSAVASTTNTMTTTFTTGGVHTVAVTVSNTAGSNSASTTVNVIACDAITSFPYIQDFEEADVYDCWTFIDADGDGYNWNTNFLRDYVDSETGEPDPQGHNGSNGLVGSASWYNQVALHPDNWMFTPAMVIPAGTTYKLAWYAKGQDSQYFAEYYSVYVSDTKDVNAIMATTPLYSGTTTNMWQLKTVDLAPYAGQTIYIAFRHHNVSDMFFLDIDDIAVGEGVGLNDHDMNISVYPNPATNSINVMGEGIQHVQILDIDGRTIMSFNEGGQLNIAGLANGMYLVRVVTENGVQMNKIIKR